MNILKFKKSMLSKFASSITIVALVLVTTLGPVGVEALGMTASKDTSTRLQISTTADHTVVFTLPATMEFDSTGTTDFLRIDFPASFTLGGTWVAGDFTFNDGTSRTINAVEQGAGDVDCTVAVGVNNVCISVDTTNNIFTIKPSSSYTASAAAATVTFTIDGTTADGTLTNPASVAATNIDFQMCDNVASCDTAFAATHSSQIAYAIIDDDTVNITASVNSSITFDLDTTAADTCGVTETAAGVGGYTVALGAITSADTRVSGATDGVNHICVDLDTNAAGGAVVTVANANGANGLVSTSVPADDIDSSTAGVADNTENYGICVVSVSDAGGTLDIAGTYVGNTCAANSETNQVDALSATPVAILNTASAPVATGRAQIAVNASINISQPSHNDYADTLTFIATATF